MTQEINTIEEAAIVLAEYDNEVTKENGKWIWRKVKEQLGEDWVYYTSIMSTKEELVSHYSCLNKLAEICDTIGAQKMSFSFFHEKHYCYIHSEQQFNTNSDAWDTKQHAALIATARAYKFSNNRKTDENN